MPTPALREPWAALGREPEVRLTGVDVQRFHPQLGGGTWRSVRLADPDALVVGSLMRAGGDKAPEVLIDAVARRDAEGRPTALMLVGDGPRATSSRRAQGLEHLHVRRRVPDAPGSSRASTCSRSTAERLVPVTSGSRSRADAFVVADTGAVASLVGRMRRPSSPRATWTGSSRPRRLAAGRRAELGRAAGVGDERPRSPPSSCGRATESGHGLRAVDLRLDGLDAEVRRRCSPSARQGACSRYRRAARSSPPVRPSAPMPSAPRSISLTRP